MSSYGSYIAACGFTYNGPKGQLGFAPKINPENFKAVFTSAQGWGSLQQIRTETSQTNTLKIAYGKLTIQEIAVELPIEKTAKTIKVTVNSQTVDSTMKKVGNNTIVLLDSVELVKNDIISIIIKL
jgi:hypothetical protein